MSDEFLKQTACEKCVFATWLPEGTQDGCQLGRTEKFVELNQVDPKSNEIGSYILTRFCNAYREEAWAKDKVYPTNAVRQEIEPSYGIILMENGHAETELVLAQLAKTLNALIIQYLRPERIVLVLNNKAVSRPVFSTFVKERLKSTGIKYFINYIVEDTEDEGKLIDYAFDSLDNQFYTLVYNGFELPIDFSEALDWVLNDLLKQFVMVRPMDDQNNGLTILTMAHLIYKGNIGISIQAKLEDLAKTTNKPELILECLQ